MNRKISLRIDNERLEFLEDIARVEGCTVSMIVRHLVYRFLENEKRFREQQLEVNDAGS